jgi:hypothetical protein
VCQNPIIDARRRMVFVVSLDCHWVRETNNNVLLSLNQ